MNWNPQMEIQYANTGSIGMPYNSIGSFVDFFGVVAYDHVNFIFAADSSYSQESFYPSPVSTNYYKYGFAEPGSFSNYNYGNGHSASDHILPAIHEYDRPLESPSIMTDEQMAATHVQREGNSSSTSDTSSVECPRHHHNSRDEVVWQDDIDPDNMTYEELLELGEAVGTQSRGLSEDLISLLPVSKFKRSLFSRRKSRNERCVICQMEYKRGDRRMTLPCKHVYHASCCRRWLGINKACPICYTEVSIDSSKR